MTDTNRKTPDESLYDTAEDTFTSEGGFVSAAHPEREREMVEFSINYDGLRYRYNGYRYDHFADAVRYARLMRSRPSQQDPGGPFTHGQTVAAPTEADRKLMALMAIRFEAGAYRFESFRYDRLEDAVNYAKLAAQRPRAGGPL
jgi:hypothetical protein